MHSPDIKWSEPKDFSKVLFTFMHVGRREPAGGGSQEPELPCDEPYHPPAVWLPGGSLDGDGGGAADS